MTLGDEQKCLKYLRRSEEIGSIAFSYFKHRIMLFGLDGNRCDMYLVIKLIKE
jgi:hypothetical protein